MIQKSGNRFSEKIMLKQESKARWRFNLKSSRFRAAGFKIAAPRLGATKNPAGAGCHADGCV
jgi:hypothetical protein